MLNLGESLKKLYFEIKYMQTTSIDIIGGQLFYRPGMLNKDKLNKFLKKEIITILVPKLQGDYKLVHHIKKQGKMSFKLKNIHYIMILKLKNVVKLD